jgi:ribonuclease HII
MPWHVGIDENGLGPQLGPLLVTAVMAQVSESARRRIRRDGGSFLHERLDDSKALVAHGKISLAEAWTRAVVERCGQGAGSPDALVEALALENRATRLSGCAEHALSQCWDPADESFQASDGQLREARVDLDSLSSKGIDVVWARSMIVCVRRLNEERRSGRGRLIADLHAMEQLIVSAHNKAGGELEVVCGKVGGLTKYLPSMSVLSNRLHGVLAQARACSSYRFAGIGTVHFVRDADGSDPLVALSSLVGKYFRELLMARIVRFYRREQPSLRDVSGYNDPVTARFVRETQPIRKRLGVPADCFRREQASDGHES